MKMKNTYIKLVFASLLIVIFIYLNIKISLIKDIDLLIICSFLIAYTLKPIYLKLLNIGLNKKLSAIFLILLLVFGTIIILIFMVPSVYKEWSNISDTLIQINNFFDGLFKQFKIISNNKVIFTILNSFYEKGNKIIINYLSSTFDSIFNIGKEIVSITVIPIISYYFLVDGEKIENRLLIFFPYNKRVLIKKIIKDIDKILSRYIMGQFFLCILIGVVTFIVLIYYKVNFPILLSIINAVFNIIPYVGPLFGAVPAIIMALIKSPNNAIEVTIFLYFLQVIEGNIISPKITGDSISMHPLIVIILLLIGDKFAGFLGMVLAVPIGVIIKVIYEDINYYLF
jgi:predicted PurR-regulated permease PerM